MSTPSVSILAVALTALIAVPASAGAPPALRCQSGKSKAAGKYDYCRQKAEAKYATSGDGALRAAALQKCLDNCNLTWALLESRAAAVGGTCRSVGDQSAIQGVIDGYTTNVATALGGGTLETDLTTCLDDVAACTVDLATCRLWQPHFPATGQTTCWQSGAVVPCAGTGQDGETQAGSPLSYTDNGDGTITDDTTGLMWEKLSDDGSIHDAANVYTWEQAFTVKVATLNGQGFAGYTDWRVPNVKEMETLVYYGASHPFLTLVPPVFHTGCMPGCTVTTCSCNWPQQHWTSSTWAFNPRYAWVVWFEFGITGEELKGALHYVRAVRGGA